MRFAHAFAALAVAACLSAAAAVPMTISYQGYLTSGGVPVNTNVNMQLKLYDAPTGGNLVWQDLKTVSVVNGVYNVVLGDPITTPLDPSFFTGPQLYLTVAVNGEDMAPRTPLASAPYAILAKALDGTLGVANGGTGASSIATNGLLYGQGTGAVGVTSPGSAGQVLTATAGGVPQWSNSAQSLLISHPGPGPLTIQSGGVNVAVQGVTFDFSGIGLGLSQALIVGGLQVVGGRQAAVANAQQAVGVDVGGQQVPTVAEFNALVAQLNAALERLRNHGLIEP